MQGPDVFSGPGRGWGCNAWQAAAFILGSAKAIEEPHIRFITLKWHIYIIHCTGSIALLDRTNLIYIIIAECLTIRHRNPKISDLPSAFLPGSAVVIDTWRSQQTSTRRK